jgi:hypothetical protein
MSGDRAEKLISDASDGLTRARVLLLQPAPRNLDMACSALAMAIAPVTGLQQAVTESPSGDLTAAVAGLRKEIDLISRLLEHAASYHVNLIQCMTEASNAPVLERSCIAPTRRLSLEA